MAEAKKRNFYKEYEASLWITKGNDTLVAEEVEDKIATKFEELKDNKDVSSSFLRTFNKLTFNFYKCEDYAIVAIIISCLYYVICPIDFIPDFIPIAGYVDDFSIMQGTIAYLNKYVKLIEPKKKMTKVKPPN